MKIENGYVKINGASDLEDSSMAFGLATVLDYFIDSSGANPFLADSYFREDGMYQRCKDSKYLFSRDQTICLVAGLLRQHCQHLVTLDKVNGKDIFSPANRGHIRICQGLKPYWYQTLWFKAELWFSAKYAPLDELNQLFCQLLVHPNKSLLRWYCDMNPQWRVSLAEYWYAGKGHWRNEMDFCLHMIKKIEELNASS